MGCLMPTNEHLLDDFTDEDVTELNDTLGDHQENHLRSIESEFMWRYKCQPKEDPLASFRKAIIVIVGTHAFAALLNSISR